jgi:heptosyltransferase-2
VPDALTVIFIFVDMNKILVIQTAFIGDAILATAVLERLHATFPEARLDLLVRKGNEGLFAGHPFLHTLHVWDKKGRKYAGLFHLLRTLRRTRYDLVVNLQRFFSTGLLTAFSGADLRVGFDKNPLSIFFTHRIAHRIGAVHEVGRNHALIELWAGPEAGRPRLYPRPQDEAGRPDDPYICLAPTSVWYTKQWPEARWVAFLDLLPPGLRVVLLGGPSDREACERIRGGTRHPLVDNKAGELGFLASAAWMAGARMNYVNDSAPLHLASAVNAPVVAIFCSTVPDFGFTPLSDASWIVETRASLPCRPCGLHGKRACPEGHFRCSEIEPEGLLRPLEQR